MLRKMYFGLVLLGISSGAMAHSLYPNITPHEIPLAKLTSSKLPSALISDNDFVYQPYFRPFDFDSFLADTQPSWQTLKEPLQHWAGATGVDPRVLLTTLAILHPKQTPTVNDIKAVANQLSQHFYYYDSHTSLTHQNYNPATLAVAQQLPTLAAWHIWQRQYEMWFDLLIPTPEVKSAMPFLADSGLMQWPWRQGYAWVPNGPHSHSGSGFPLSSIDVSYDWPKWGAPTYSVTAAHDGYVTVMSRCQVRVINPNGWATNYYHMDGIQVGNNQWVTRDTKLGVYANQRSIALCEGGSSTGPHLHFSLLFQGRFQSLQGVQFGPYQVHTGRYSYDNDCRHTWLYDTREQRKVCLFQRVDNPAR
ncbi:M23 family metallopeptidase [Photobacterium sp.]|uniref:M23 family metallopeptidase n=1 Tax=Photobacterium sp. TaxID=660 RepID=UPI00299D5023|nr:M23 family metallopeptidase [Photobacterium sp.]MDX1301199.1 M23 family metallopeptidase [Photobacterium sp.]